MGKFQSKSSEETAKFAFEFAQNLTKGEKALVIGLYGELGSGKTRFMKGIGEYFNVNETVQSPTFVIEKIYELKDASFRHLIHIDAYRIEKDEEMINLGWREITDDPNNLIFVEWPERISPIMPKHTKIFFEHSSVNERKIEIQNG